MKKPTQTDIDTINCTWPLDPPRPKSATALSKVANEFLRSRPAANPADPELVYAVVAMATWLGPLRIGRVTPSDVAAALRCSHPVLQIRSRLVPGIRRFFDWSRAKCYLPGELPTPADQLE